ncbi:Metallo-dependent hydrolase [Dentipellis sp. KUC8613]|nr:Metallo-dependent hydrolase [Dentipellis sp. KUC8613]
MTVTSTIHGPASAALAALTPAQIAFLERLPKAELHAHLNGSIPLALLQDLAREHAASASADSDAVRAGLQRLQAGVQLDEIGDFFGLFPAIYALMETPDALRRAAQAVLRLFLEEGEGGAVPQVAYLELRSTPKETPHMSRRAYLETVLDEVERYPAEKAALIVSLDRRMDGAVAEEIIAVCAQLKAEGRRVVGVDLCGDPMAGNMAEFKSYFAKAREAGLGVTLHIAETDKNPSEETLELLACRPQRLGHATFLDAAAKAVVHSYEPCIELCLTSNLLCKTVKTLEDHHIQYYLKHGHPIAICTDDVLPFRNSMLGEYALLMAPKPLGLGLSEQEIATVAKMSMEHRFKL